MIALVLTCMFAPTGAVSQNYSNSFCMERYPIGEAANPGPDAHQDMVLATINVTALRTHFAQLTGLPAQIC